MAASPDPGALNQRVTFQRSSVATDGGGGGDLTWANIAGVATVWAKVEPVTGRERQEGGQLEAAVGYLVTIRRRSDLTPGLRVVWVTNNNLPLQLREVRDAGVPSQFMVLACEQGVAV